MIETLRDLKIQIAAPEKSGTEKLPSTRELLDSLEEIKDGRAYKMDMRQIIHTLIDETTKEEKKQKIIALLKAEKETMEKMADKKAYHTYNANMK